MAAVLYTPGMLALAISLSGWPWDDALPLRATARSQSCGSTLGIGLALDGDGRITRVGVKPQACAVGQAAAAIFADAAVGRDAAMIGDALAAIERWLTDGGAVPDWPALTAIAAAHGYPGRHGAILLPWRAAADALASARPTTA